MTKTLFTIAAAVLSFAATAAMADEVRDYPTPSSLTRAEVQAELAQARARQTVGFAGESYGVVAPTVVAAAARQADGSAATALSRVEVRRDLARSRAGVDAQRELGESYGGFAPTLASVRTRDEVRAEARAAARDRSVDMRGMGG